MQSENRWLQPVMSIEEETPYASNLTSVSQPPDGDATPLGEVLSVAGITVFRVKNGNLTFQFFVNGDGHFTAVFEVLKTSNMTLSIPTNDFNQPVKVMSLSGDARTLSGFVDVAFFGDNYTILSGVTIYLTGLPQKWYGNDNWSHYEVMSTEQAQIQDADTVVIPKGRLGARALSGFTLEVDGWTAKLREIPRSQRTDPNIAHVCIVTNENRPLTGTIAQDFLDETLFPFLSFVFGQHTRFHTMVGYKDGVDSWVRTSPHTDPPLKPESTEGRPWGQSLKKPSGAPLNLG